MVEQLRGAEEVWITRSTREVVPVTPLDGEPVGTERAGALWAPAYEALQTAKFD